MKKQQVKLGEEYVFSKSGNIVKVLEFTTIKLGRKNLPAATVERRNGKQLLVVLEALLPLSVLDE